MTSKSMLPKAPSIEEPPTVRIIWDVKVLIVEVRAAVLQLKFNLPHDEHGDALESYAHKV